LAQGLPPRIARRRAAVWRDASLHSDLRVVVGCARHRNSRRAPSAHDGQIEVWPVAHDQSRLRLDDDQVHGVVSDETSIRIWLGRTADIRCVVNLRRLCISDEVRELAASCRLYSNAAPRFDDGAAGAWRAVLFEGVTGRDAGTHVPRIASEKDLCRPRA